MRDYHIDSILIRGMYMVWERTDPSLEARKSGEQISIEYTETDGLLWLSVKNFLLSLVTLSLYRFWGKTHVRRHVWSNVKINGEALEYTGTGMELFLGALLVFAIIGLPAIAILTTAQIMFGPESPQFITIQIVFFLIVFLLFGMAIYRARRYRLSRTLWRGIRGTLTGSSTSFSLLYFASMLLKGITLGWSTPAMNLNIQQRMIGDMSFGSKSFQFDGPAGPLYSRFAVCWFGTPVLLIIIGLIVGAVVGGSGLVMDLVSGDPDEAMKDASAGTWMLFFLGALAIWLTVLTAFAVLWTFYTAREMSLFANYTSFDKATFQLNATVPSLVTLWLGNLAIMIFTLGIGQPYVVQRLVRYLCDRLSVEGTVDIAGIQQSSAAIDKRGEGLVEAFDIDAF